MIIREWRGRAEPARADDYVRHFRNVVVPELHRVAGFLGAYLSRHTVGDVVEYVVLTRWESMDAIRAFAGPMTGECGRMRRAASSRDMGGATCAYDGATRR